MAGLAAAGFGRGRRRFRRGLILGGFGLRIRTPTDRLSIMGGTKQRQTTHPYKNSLQPICVHILPSFTCEIPRKPSV